MFDKLSRLAVNWQSQPEMLRRYWDQAMSSIENLRLRMDAVEGDVDTVYANAVPTSSLPTSPTYRRAIVNDATSTTFHDIVSGGGSNIVPVFYDGTNWRIG